ncbi:MAG: hypothetical protein IIX32_01635 [Alistipes sp.]|nr:hypothetical protein [Alistipes sp.]
MNLKRLLFFVVLVGSVFVARAEQPEQPKRIITVNTKRVGAEIKPTMWGLFFEDINYAADGGISNAVAISLTDSSLETSSSFALFIFSLL